MVGARLPLPAGGMVALLPDLMCGQVADHALLTDLHAAADAESLQEPGMDQVLPAGHDAGGRAAQELVRAVDGDVAAALQEAFQVVFGGGVDDDRNAAGMRDGGELLERDLTELHGMMGYDVEGERTSTRLNPSH